MRYHVMVCTNYGNCYESEGHPEYRINYTFEWKINGRIDFSDVKPYKNRYYMMIYANYGKC